MKICIPTVDELGLKGKPSDHFGSAPFFTVVDTDSWQVEVIPNGGHGHGGSCAPTEMIGEKKIDAVACRGMGGPAREAVVAQGIEVLQAVGDSVAEVAEAASRGDLTALDPGQACGGHHLGTMGDQHDCHKHQS
jgi:predicted Fe-Mo cluster-binding NifX family protein